MHRLRYRGGWTTEDIDIQTWGISCIGIAVGGRRRTIHMKVFNQRGVEGSCYRNNIEAWRE